MKFGDYTFNKKVIAKKNLDLDFLIRDVANFAFEEALICQGLSYKDKINLILKVGDKFEQSIKDNKERLINESLNSSSS